MGKSRKKQVGNKRPDVWVSLALAITLFVLSIYLFFDKNYFSAVTNTIQAICWIIGFPILGISLSNMKYKELEKTNSTVMEYDKFGFVGVGIATLITWGLIHNKFFAVWVNILLFPVLFFGIYAITLGLVNLLKAPSTVKDVKNSFPKKDAKSIFLTVAKAFSGLIGFVAAILQLLQYFKLIP